MKTINFYNSLLWPKMALILLMLLLPVGANALVINFEDAPSGPWGKGTSYKSLHWNNVSIIQSSLDLLDGKVAYGSSISIYTGPFEYFNLESLELASESANTIWIEAFTFSDSKFKKEVELENLDEVLLDLNLLGITKIDLWSEDNSTFMIDNLKVSWLCGGGECGTVKTSGIPSTPPSNPPCTPPPYPPNNTNNNNPNPNYPPSTPPTCPPPCPPPQSPTPVPEPSTLVLMVAGMAAMSRMIKKSR